MQLDLQNLSGYFSLMYSKIVFMERNKAKPDNIHTTENDNLNPLFVRPIAPEEDETWNDLMSKHHYLDPI